VFRILIKANDGNLDPDTYKIIILNLHLFPNPSEGIKTKNIDTSFKGTPTKRQVSKRQVSKRLVSKRLKRQVYKTSGLQNVRFTKRQVIKTSGCKMSGFKTSLLVNISKRPV
jgi:hypothetical protein